MWTFFAILMTVWLAGVLTSNTMGGLIHILLVMAIATALIRLIQGRRPVS